MTLIECFSASHVDNMIECLRLRPQKLVFLGDQQVMAQHVKRYREFLKNRKMNTQVEMQNVQLDNMTAVTVAMSKVVREASECVIDVTGGAEQLLMAVGAVLAGLDEEKRKLVTVQKYDMRRAQMIDCDGDGKVIPGAAAALSTRELIALHGGTIHPAPEQPDKRCTPADIQPLWEEVSRDNRGWNRKLAILNEFESRSESKEDVYLRLDEIAGGITDFEEKESLYRELLDTLDSCGVIKNRSGYNTIRYTYINAMLHDCVRKAGNMLETKTLLEARALLVDGKPFFQDCQMGVNIDWDGEIHDSEHWVPETRNEIDVIAVRGMVPLFISCKNGDIGDEELYKLNTVAERFGSRYARKMLIASDMDKNGIRSKKSLMQRAKDMGICLVTDARNLSREGWRRILREAMEE